MKKIFFVLAALFASMSWSVAQGYRVATDETYENGLRLVEVRSDLDEPVEFSVIAMDHPSYAHAKYRMIINFLLEEKPWALKKGDTLELWLGREERVVVTMAMDATNEGEPGMYIVRCPCELRYEDLPSMASPILLIEAQGRKRMVGPEEARRVVEMFQVAARRIMGQ